LPKSFRTVDIRQPGLYQEFIDDFGLKASCAAAPETQPHQPRQVGARNVRYQAGARHRLTPVSRRDV
jgi:hypothetical protein